MAVVNKPRDKTLEKVLKVIQKSKHPMSKWSIRKQANTSWDSINACLDILIERGQVKEIVTSNGTFYNYVGDSN